MAFVYVALSTLSAPVVLGDDPMSRFPVGNTAFDAKFATPFVWTLNIEVVPPDPARTSKIRDPAPDAVFVSAILKAVWTPLVFAVELNDHMVEAFEPVREPPLQVP